MSSITEWVQRGAAVPGVDAGPHSCQCVNILLGINLGACGEPAAGRFRRACVHGHIRDGWMCQGHVDAMGAGLCLACIELDGGLSHECPITVVPLGLVQS